ncbi:MAG TPA: hypothetical protein VHB50_09305 [Bryobacteraceae bacterium]|nr:hypothetical protein [Bryobacteraceae bacterium]
MSQRNRKSFKKAQQIAVGSRPPAQEKVRRVSILAGYGCRFTPQNDQVPRRFYAQFHARPGQFDHFNFDAAAKDDSLACAAPQH